MKRLCLAVVVLLVLVIAGCASSDENLQRETARLVGDVLSNQVTISNVDRGATSVTWEADTPKGHYKCEADDMLRRGNCVKQN